MAAVIIPVPKEINGGVIPDDTSIRVESLPKRNLVYSGIVSESASCNIGPGKYVVVLVKKIDEETLWMRDFEFYHEVTEDQFEVLKRIKPKRAKARQVSDGIVMFTCTQGYCNKKTSSEVEMAIHEATEHLGMTKEQLLDPKNYPDIELILAEKEAKLPNDTPEVKGKKRAEVLGTARPVLKG